MTYRAAKKLRLAPTVVVALFAALPHSVLSQVPVDPVRNAERAYRSTYKAAPAADFLIAGGTVLDGIGRRHERTDILLRGGKIVAIGPNLPRTGDVTIVDAADRWVTPGIIDVHSHNGTFALPLTPDSLSDISELSGPNVANTWIEHAINVQDPAFRRALEGGVTALQILPGSVPIFGGRSVILKPVPANTVYEMKFPAAPQGLKIACGENPKTTFGEKGVAPTSRQGEIALIREAWLEARRYLESLQKPVDDSTERNLMLETLAGVLKGEIRVHLHCYRADDIAVMFAVAREFGYKIAAVHHASEAYKIPGLFREAEVCAAVWADWWGFKMEAIDSIRANAAFVDAAGACALLHSDSPFTGQRLNLEAAKAMAAGRAEGLDIGPERAIAWITSNPARVLGLEDSIGRIAEGYNADVVLWSGNPFSIYSKADQVYIDGVLRIDRANCKRSHRLNLDVDHAESGVCQ